jgi:hypothetical protein
MSVSMGSSAISTPAMMNGFLPQWSDRLPTVGAQMKERMDPETNDVQLFHVTA